MTIPPWHKDAVGGRLQHQSPYSVYLEAGETYIVTLQNSDGFTGGRSKLDVYSPSGSLYTTATSASANNGVEIGFSAWTSGTYTFGVSDAGGRTGNYEFSLQVAQDITFTDAVVGRAYMSGKPQLYGDNPNRLINVADNWSPSSDKENTPLESYAFLTQIHEIGHALGLYHSGPYNGTGDFESEAVFANDTRLATVMSYFNPSQAGMSSAANSYPVSFMPADIIAIQNLYGAGSIGAQTGNTVWGPGGNIAGSLQGIIDSVYEQDQVYSWYNYGYRFSYTIYDTDGIDTLDYSGYSDNQNLSLVELEYSDVRGFEKNVVIARGTVIENAISGAGNDRLTGNDVANILIGNAGNDSLYGGLGDDTLIGGAGSDLLDGGAGNDTVRYDLDETSSGVTVNLANASQNTGVAAGDSYVSIESVIGTAHSDALYGDSNANTLSGLAGYDVIYGNSGHDLLDGGAGNDTLHAGSSGLNLLVGG